MCIHVLPFPLSFSCSLLARIFIAAWVLLPGNGRYSSCLSEVCPAVNGGWLVFLCHGDMKVMKVWDSSVLEEEQRRSNSLDVGVILLGKKARRHSRQEHQRERVQSPGGCTAK